MEYNLPQNAVGLVKGRHDIPVNRYIFDSVEDVLDFEAIQQQAEKFIITDGKTELDVVVTGLTACTAAVIYICSLRRIDLTLWHYDRDNDRYVPQKFYF